MENFDIRFNEDTISQTFSSYIQFDCEGYALSYTFYRIKIELLVFKLCPVLFNWRSSPEFDIVPKKYRTGPKPIQTPVPLRPSAGWDPNWSTKATFHLTISMGGQCATGKIQRNNYHHGS